MLNEKERMKQKIDDGSTPDALYFMYHQISTAMDSSDAERRRCGEFAGTLEELIALRDRVASRVAIFPLYAKALHECKAAAADL